MNDATSILISHERMHSIDARLQSFWDHLKSIHRPQNKDPREVRCRLRGDCVVPFTTIVPSLVPHYHR